MPLSNLALKEPNMNNPQRQLGDWDYNPSPALKELNISVKEKTSHPGLFHILEGVFYTLPQMLSFCDVPFDS